MHQPHPSHKFVNSFTHTPIPPQLQIHTYRDTRMPRISERRKFLDDLETGIEDVLVLAVVEGRESTAWRMAEDLLAVHEILSIPRNISPRGRGPRHESGMLGIGTRRNNLGASRTAGRKKVAGTGRRVTEKRGTTEGTLEAEGLLSRSQDLIAIESGSQSTTEKTPAVRAPRERTPADGDGSGDDFEWDATPPRSTRTCSITQSPAPRRKGGSRTESVKRSMEERRLDHELKKAKIEQQMEAERTMYKNKWEVMHREHLERLEVMHREHLERLDQISASMKSEVARIQADAQARQSEFLSQWIGRVNWGINQKATNELINQPTS